jgi:hypothetical protein
MPWVSRRRLETIEEEIRDLRYSRSVLMARIAYLEIESKSTLVNPLTEKFEREALDLRVKALCAHLGLEIRPVAPYYEVVKKKP